MATQIDLGFPENCESWRLESRLFPSKIGGKPAWLDLENLPQPSELQCEICKEPVSFLLQIYAPFEDKEDCFHRTLFIFICRKESCYEVNNDNKFIIFRNQLRRENPYYSFLPPADQPDATFDLEKFEKLCKVCGCLAPHRCSKCQDRYYCSQKHQVIDWKTHKKNCAKSVDNQSEQSIVIGEQISNDKIATAVVFSEYEIMIEPEEIESKETDEKKELDKYEKLVSEGKSGTMKHVDDSELSAYSVEEDETFMKFKKRINYYPQQILRYERNGEPLWISQNQQPTPDQIPNCQYCGGRREFEGQILPQIILYLKDDNIDFGILALYTCASSCNNGPAYKKEFIFKQNIT